VNEGGISALVDLIQRSLTSFAGEPPRLHLGHKAAAALALIASVPGRFERRIVDEGALPPLIELLRNGDIAAKASAAGALQSLATADDCAASIVSAGGILPLIELLRSGASFLSGSPGADVGGATDDDAFLVSTSKRAAALALGNLAHIENAEMGNAQDVIASAGALGPLVHMLRLDAESASAAAGAIANLAYKNAANARQAESLGAIPLLVEMLRSMIDSSDTEGSTDACAALANLANADKACQRLIGETGAIGLLIRVLQGDGSDEMWAQGYAADALADIAYENEPNQVRIAAEGGIAPLVQLLKSDGASLVAMGDAAKALANLAFKNEANQSTIGAEDGVETLVEMLRAFDERLDDDAVALTGNVCEALGHLAFRNEKNQTRIVECGGVRGLIKVLRESACADSSANAAATLEGITTLKLDPILLEAIAAALSDCRSKLYPEDGRS
jgi:hypothetical protein